MKCSEFEKSFQDNLKGMVVDDSLKISQVLRELKKVKYLSHQERMNARAKYLLMNKNEEILMTICLSKYGDVEVDGKSIAKCKKLYKSLVALLE